MSEFLSWKHMVRTQPVDSEWLHWFMRSWRVSSSEFARKVGVSRMQVYRWMIGRSPVPDYVAEWAKANLPTHPALPYPGMPEVALEPATELERRAFAELDLVHWSKPRKRRAA